VDAHHPLIWGKLDFSCEIVDVLDERPQNYSGPLGSVLAHSIDDVGSEIGVIFRGIGCAIGLRHGLNSWDETDSIKETTVRLQYDIAKVKMP
jgi:hypothetical protein